MPVCVSVGVLEFLMNCFNNSNNSNNSNDSTNQTSTAANSNNSNNITNQTSTATDSNKQTAKPTNHREIYKAIFRITPVVNDPGSKY